MTALSRGQLWKAKNTVICNLASTRGKKRRLVVEEGEIVEFRYPVDANFRVDDNGQDLYLHLSEEEFRENFEYFGKIFREVSWVNRNSMKQILECELYEKVKS